MKKLLLVLYFTFVPLLLAQSVQVSGTGVRNGTGAPLSGGQWCFGSQCVNVANGTFNGTVNLSSGQVSTVTVTSLGSTVLTVPFVYMPTGVPYNWNSYVAPTNAQLTGTGNPYLPCFVGSRYTGSNGTQYCQSYNGQASWGQAQTPVPAGQYTGHGGPIFACVSPCQYSDIDSSILYVAKVEQGFPTTTWVAVSGGTSGASLTFGFIIGNGTAGNNVGPVLIAARSGSLTKCKVVVKTSDGATPFTFKINKNGTNIFTSNPTLAPGASGISTFSTFTSNPLLIAADDLFTIDITSGSANWAVTIQLE
jgi:hypothetical protein